MWVRGLKLLLRKKIGILSKSHPMWVRGLKHKIPRCATSSVRRTPCGCVD